MPANDNTGPYCPPLKIRFPIVWRIVHSMTREELDAIGMPEWEPFRDFVSYTIEPELAHKTHKGTVELAPLHAGPPEPGAPTLIVRYHPNQAHCDGYLCALWDHLGFPEPDEGDDDYERPNVSIPGESVTTAEGIFSLQELPKHRWDATEGGPLLIYLASPEGNWTSWYLALAVDGSEVELSDCGAPPGDGFRDFPFTDPPDEIA